MLGSFLSTWTSLNEKLHSQRDQLEDETLANVHHVASVIGVVASGMLELEIEKERVRDELHEDISKILHDPMDNLVIRDENMPTEVSGLPPYIKPAYDWLLSNLHNPYPSQAVKRSIARQSGSALKNIDTWFVDVRKRIGWNQLRRKHFSNKRDEIIEAATQFFKPPGQFYSAINSYTHTSLSPSELNLFFTTLKNHAEALYPGQCLNSPITAKTWKSPSPNIGNEDCLKKRPYPTPAHSPDGSPTRSSPPLPSSQESTMKRSRKRRERSPHPSDGSDVEYDSGSARKRIRSDTVATSQHFTYLPSPAPSLPEALPNSQRQSPKLSMPLLSTSQSCGKRKRCVSDTESPHFSKRRQVSPSLLGIEPSDDTLLSPITLENWPQDSDHLELSGKIPDAVSAEVLDQNIPFEVQCYQYDFSPYMSEIDLGSDSESLRTDPSACPSLFAPSSSVLSENLYYPPSMQELFQGSTGFSNTQDLTFDLGLGSIPSPSYQDTGFLAFCEPSPVDSFPCFPVLDISTHQQMSGLGWSSLLCHPVDEESPIQSDSIRPPVLGDFNTSTKVVDGSQESVKAARLRRAQILRDELRQLEADIAI